MCHLCPLVRHCGHVPDQQERGGPHQRQPGRHPGHAAQWRPHRRDQVVGGETEARLCLQVLASVWRTGS